MGRDNSFRDVNCLVVGAGKQGETVLEFFRDRYTVDSDSLILVTFANSECNVELDDPDKFFDIIIFVGAKADLIPVIKKSSFNKMRDCLVLTITIDEYEKGGLKSVIRTSRFDKTKGCSVFTVTTDEYASQNYFSERDKKELLIDSQIVITNEDVALDTLLSAYDKNTDKNIIAACWAIKAIIDFCDKNMIGTDFEDLWSVLSESTNITTNIFGGTREFVMQNVNSFFDRIKSQENEYSRILVILSKPLYNDMLCLDVSKLCGDLRIFMGAVSTLEDNTAVCIGTKSQKCFSIQGKGVSTVKLPPWV